MKVEFLTIGRTFNIGNYESIRVELTVDPESQALDTVTEEIGAELEGLKNHYLRLYRTKKGK